MRHDVRRVPALVALALTLGVSLPAQAMDLAASGSFSLGIDASDLTSGAGSELQDSHDSGTGAIALQVSATSGSTDAWRIDIRRASSGWDPDLRLWARRTGDGSGDGSIAGGASWQEIGTTDSTFFSGEGDRSSITVQVRITGVSLAISPDSFLSTVHYTLVDTL
ncbi:hypothetical protein L6R53_00665 [Myxococcota bacterium]|nr:hypothetical protein [Myxococcota bacterium]